MNETYTIVFILVGCEFNIKLLGLMGQKLLFLYRICADTMYMPYLQALLSESIKLKLMFSQYGSGMMLQEWFKYIRSSWSISSFERYTFLMRMYFLTSITILRRQLKYHKSRCLYVMLRTLLYRHLCNRITYLANVLIYWKNTDNYYIYGASMKGYY